MTAPAPRAVGARIHGPGDVRVGPEPIERAGRGDVLLRVTAVGLCGSDLHWWQEGSIGDARISRPLVLGHEIGAVIERGPGAGTRVALDPARNCGRCRPCREHRENLCLAMRFAGHGVTDGGLRTFMAWPSRLLVPVPDRIPDDVVPLLEPLGVAIHAAGLVGLGPGVAGAGAAGAGGAAPRAAAPPVATAGVYGCGPLGLLIVAVLKAAGVATVVATDKLAHRVAAAASLGANALLVGAAGEAASGRERVRGLEVDVAFEAAGSDEALSDAIAAVRPGGTVVLVGIPPHDRTTFEAAAARRKELTLIECRRMMPDDLGRAAELVASGAFDPAPLITHRFGIGEARQAFETLAARRGVKTIVYPSIER